VGNGYFKGQRIMRASQKGFTLIELVVSLGIAGMISAVIIASVFHTYSVSRSSRDQTTGVLQVQTAGLWISRDAKMAVDTVPADAAAGILDTLTLQWTNQYDDVNTDHTVQYYLSGTELKRDYDGVVATVSRYISDVDFSRNGSVITAVITSTPDDVQEQIEKATYYVTIRQ
jgi:prepilin-type N-terminal cleavage/methylation domain-containing protein